MCDLIKKIIGGVVLAVIVTAGAGSISKAAFKPDELEQQAYMVSGEGSAGTTAAAEPKAALTPEQFAALVDAGSAENGKKTFKKCAACHTDDPAGTNKMGPGLFGVVNRDIGKHAGFAYSAPVASHGGTWTVDHLNHWITNPKDYISGNKMSFAGIKKDQERADLIAYLKTLK